MGSGNAFVRFWRRKSVAEVEVRHDGMTHWQALLNAARELSRESGGPFSRRDLIARVQATEPDRQSDSLSPIIQGLTANTPGGAPQSSVGKVFRRVGRGLYELLDNPQQQRVESPERTRNAGGSREAKRAEIESRLRELTADFERYITEYDRRFPFRRDGQFELHESTIRRRRELETIDATLADDEFLEGLRATLKKWGIGLRGSRMVGPDDFDSALRERRAEFAALESLSIEAADLDIEAAYKAVWHLVETLGIVENKSKIVPGTKALHHLLPDLVVPMDRAWTGLFFGWTAADPQDNQERTFTRTFEAYARVARLVQPSNYVGAGWRTSATKVLDNAMIGYCLAHRLNEDSESS